jgi:hypothetical protein
MRVAAASISFMAGRYNILYLEDGCLDSWTATKNDMMRVEKTATMDYTANTRNELVALCKEKKREENLGLLAQDTGKGRKNRKDQFYTKGSVAKQCVDILLTTVPNARTYTWIEPSAGSGAFLQCVPASVESIGLDIDPTFTDILQADFLTWSPPSPPTERQYLIFGNPPFGRQASLAKAFLRRSCQMAEVIAYILPRSFMKPSMTNVIDSAFHCLYNQELGKDSFEINGAAHDVPCVFQIWQKQATARAIAPKLQERGFRYVRAEEPYDLAFRRVGALAGRCYPSGSDTFSPQTHYFWKLDAPFVARIPAILARINAHVFPSNTVGPRSLSKTEANEVMNVLLETTERAPLG